MLARRKRLFPLLPSTRSDSGSAGIMLCKKLLMLLLHILMLLVAEMLADMAVVTRALLLGMSALLELKLPSASKSGRHLCINMHITCSNGCCRCFPSARAGAAAAPAAGAARGLREELEDAHQRSGLPTGRAFNAGGPESAAGSRAANHAGAILAQKKF